MKTIDSQKVQIMFQALATVKGQNWDMLSKVDQDKVVKSMQAIEDYYALQGGRTPAPIKVETMPSGAFGAFSSTDGCIHISKDWVTNNVPPARQVEGNCQILNTIIHEGEHAYQNFIINKPNHKLTETEKKWRDNEDFYHGDNDQTYRFQPQEVDAFNFADQEINKIFTQLKQNDPIAYVTEEMGYKQYQNACYGNEQNYLNGITEANALALSNNTMAALVADRDSRIAIINLVDPKKTPSNVLEEYQFYAKNIMNSSNVSPWEGHVLERDKQIVKFMLANNKYTANEIANALEQASPQFVPNHPGATALDFVQSISKSLHMTPRLQSDISQGDQKAKVLNTIPQSVNDVDKIIHPVKIDDLRSILNVRMDEIAIQQKEINHERQQVAGPPLTKEQAEKLAASHYVKGEDQKLNQQASDLKIKQDKLSQYEKDTIAFGKEHNLDKTLWRYAPEIFKGEGLKNYEASLASIKKDMKDFERQATDIQIKGEQLKERLNTPEARLAIAKKGEEYFVKDQERLTKLEPLDRKFNELQKEQKDITKLKNVLPAKMLEKEINLQGDSKDVQDILRQTERIKQDVRIHEIKNTLVTVNELPRNPHSKELFDAYGKEALVKNGQGWTVDTNKIVAENMLKDGIHSNRVEDALKHSPEKVENTYYFVKDINNNPEIQQSRSIGISR